jgi:hypothetical protein
VVTSEDEPLTATDESDRFHQPLCIERGRRCNPAQSPECLCWWESSDPTDFEARYRARRANYRNTDSQASGERFDDKAGNTAD